MDDDWPVTRCPFCGSVLTTPLARTGMRECRYHLCRAVFPDDNAREPAQAPLVCESGTWYTDRDADRVSGRTGSSDESPPDNSGRLPEWPG